MFQLLLVVVLITLQTCNAADIYYCDNNCRSPGLFCIINNPSGFTQCDESGNRFVKTCSPGTVFHPTLTNCVFPSSSVPTCSCSNPIDPSIIPTPSPYGMVDAQCLACICLVETGCDPNAGCSDGYCGPYRISYPYYLDCGVNGGGYEACTKNITCAEQCIQGYMARYAQYCVGPSRSPTCQDFARIHDTGINGCNDPASIPYWNQVNMCYTTGTLPSQQTTIRPSGMVGSDCMDCICKVETGCNPNAGCGGGYCGPYQITYAYYLDCGVNGGGYEACTKNMTCAEQCIQNYMARYAQTCVGPSRSPTCQDFARIHDVGINGCNDPASIPYWNQVNACLTSDPSQRPSGMVDADCMDCICHVETGCNPNAGCSSGYCGPYQITYAYYLDCGVNGGGYEACTKNMTCAEQCIQGYMARYAQNCVGTGRSPTCQDFARIHDVGINGCNDPASIPYWNEVNTCLTSDQSQTTIRPSGMVDSLCMDCICNTETGCDPNAGCSGGYCGPYRISYPYYVDCGVNGGGYEACANNMACSEQCIQNYMARYAQNCVGSGRSPTCQDFARIHDVGINGCNDPSSIPYWNDVNACYSSGTVPSQQTTIHPPGLVDGDCLECICEVETGCDPNAGCSGGYCGPYRITYPYYVDCGAYGGGYEACTRNMQCAEQCIQGYMKRYAQTCVGPNRSPTCQDFSRIHDVGINGCNDPSSLPYWYQVESCLANNNSSYTRPGKVDEKCYACLCDAETGCDENVGCTNDGYCGPYHISQAYYDDCGVDGGGYLACTNDKACSEQCIQGYMDRYLTQCPSVSSSPTCSDIAQVHKGGPFGCLQENAVEFANTVNHCYTNSAPASTTKLSGPYFYQVTSSLALLTFLVRSNSFLTTTTD